MKKLFLTLIGFLIGLTVQAEETYYLTGPIFPDGSQQMEMKLDGTIATATALFHKQTFNIVKYVDGVENTIYGPTGAGDITYFGDYTATETTNKWVFSGVVIPDQTAELVLKFDTVNHLLSITKSEVVEPDPGTGGDNPSTGQVYEGIFNDIFSMSLDSGVAEYPYTLYYKITYNTKKTLNIQASIVWGEKGAPIGAIDTMYIFVDKEYTTTRLDANIETDAKYKLGNEVTMSFKIPAYNGNEIKPIITYIVGSTNETVEPSEPRIVLTASAQNITDTSVSIAYDVTLPEGYEDANVTVTYNEEEAQKNPILLTGLTESTDYSYTLVATAEKEGMETLTSDEVVVSFRTLRDPSKEIHN